MYVKWVFRKVGEFFFSFSQFFGECSSSEVLAVSEYKGKIKKRLNNMFTKQYIQTKQTKQYIQNSILHRLFMIKLLKLSSLI